MIICTLVLILNNQNEILLAMKKRGNGVGWWNGPGGKALPGESPEDACRRETMEEVGLQLGKLEKRGTAEFHFAGKDLVELCHVFVCRDFTGEPVETEEMRPQWFHVSEIPWDKMWDGDSEWIPKVLKGETINLRNSFDEHLKFIRMEDLNTAQDS